MLRKASRKRSDRPIQGELNGESQYVPDGKLSHQRKINTSDNAEVENMQRNETATEHEQSAPAPSGWIEPRFNLNRIRPH
jgi:hypothetical protein